MILVAKWSLFSVLSHTVHCEAIHIKAPAVHIFHILHSGFQMRKRVFFDVFFDPSFQNMKGAKKARVNSVTDEGTI